MNKKFFISKLFFPLFTLFIFAFFSTGLATAEIDISDRPLDVEFQAASTTVMFLLDDSGSMDSEQMTRDSEGRLDGYYIFDYSHYFDTYQYATLADPATWILQWFGYNKIYYKPSVTYEPWQSNTAVDSLLPAANMLNPLTHEFQSGVDFDDWSRTFNIAGEFLSVGISSTSTIAFDTYKDQSGDVKDPDGFVPLGTITVASGDGDSWQLVLERDAGSYTMAPVVRFKKGAEVIYVSPGDNEYSDTEGWDTSGNTTYGGVYYKYTNYSGATATYKPTLSVGDWEISYFERASAYWGRTRFYAERKPSISIKNSHYYLLDDIGGGRGAGGIIDATKANNGVADAGEALYLVNIDGSDVYATTSAIERKFYRVANNDLNISDGELTEILRTAIPEAIRPPENDREDLQNFANWFSFYSRRELVAKASVGKTIGQLQGMKVGLYAINKSVNLAALPLSDTGGAAIPANKFKLLTALYEGKPKDSTPLRQGLKEVGEYYRGNTTSVKARNATGAEIDATSPYENVDDGGGCQQVYTIAMTDGYWTDDSYYTSFTGFPDRPENLVDPDSEDAIHHDGYSNTLADVASFYYTTDLQPTMANSVPTNLCDNNIKQHMVTYAVSFGVTGTLNPDDFDPCTLIRKTWVTGDPLSQKYPAWPTTGVEDNNPEKIDDLFHAAAVSNGKFFSANNPNELITALGAIFTGIAAREIAGSSVAVSTGKIYSSANMYQGKYHSDKWTGDVESFVINYNSSLEGIQINMDRNWGAAESLGGLAHNLRKIITYNPDSSLALGSRGVRFIWNDTFPNELANTHKNLLLGLPAGNTTIDSAEGEDLVNYLRGKEDAAYRTRGTYKEKIVGSTPVAYVDKPNNKLGDIVHSSPIMIDDYVYVGANDGMLHAFHKITGIEAFAYIPYLVFENLNQIADENYQHKFFVDQTPVYAKISPTEKYVLGGLGKGGKGYYCLNISEVGTLSASETLAKDMVAWEFTDEQMMGYSYSKPVVVKTNSAAHPYVVIVGNGYNSVAGEGAFFIIDLRTGIEVRKFPTQVASDNGISSPIATDVNNDYIVDYVYAGDLKGNLWKLDLSSSLKDEWDFAFYDDAKPAPLFKTMDNQPITSRPDVIRHCNSHGYLVAFGTGKYLGVDDLSNTDPQALYAVWDYGDDSDNGESLGKFEGNMEAATIQTVSNHPDGTYDSIDVEVRMLYQDPGSAVEQTDGANIKCTGTAFADWQLIDDNIDQNPNQTPDLSSPMLEKGNPTRDIGWFLPLNGNKERIIQDPMIISGTLIAISLNPVSDVCSGGGHSMVYALDICDGAQHVCAWTTPDKKLLPTPVVIETPVGEKLIFGSEGVGSGDTTIDSDRAGAEIPQGIFWWQEINK